MTAARGDNEQERVGLRRRGGHGGSDGPVAEASSSNASSSGSGSRNAAPAPTKSLVELLFSPISYLLGDGEAEDPQMSAVAFNQSLRIKYGDHCPRFEHSSFRDAVTTARTASKFLLVYLHSNLHDETDSFCRHSLCTEELATYLNDNVALVSWGGCVQQAEGFGVSLSLGCAKFPYLALLTCVSRGVNVVEKITGNVSARIVIRQLNAAIERNNQILATARHIQQQRTEAQTLREQQDREYQESLEADRLREEEARRHEELERLREEEEIAQAIRQEQEEREREEMKKNAIQSKRERLVGSEPPSRRPPPGAGYKTAFIKFHLHNGQRLERVFYAHDTLSLVRDFIDVEFHDRDIAIVNYELATNFPKRTFGPDLLKMTLEEAGLSPQALVFVQDLDS
ncbi:TPA: hypothetical protein N0F65_009341 [Lagenidium giganteum]|uniref:UBX domain-containing protein n=1 Tax=Lagenidium giganteum TaxID=4803 RepID=A0AAV2YKJ4_9STRA|nr:TPA: hypothetical protein N0F65_009341 [Lagenidium giganteum]